jgi:hypothetical protein
MSMELVDATLGGDDQAMIAAARGWAASAARAEQISWYRNLTGCSEFRAAELADLAAGVEYREQAQREAEAERRRDVLESQNWLAERTAAEGYARAGVAPPSTPLEVARHHAAMMDDGPGRDPRLPYGSEGNPAVLVQTSHGLVDLGLQRERQHAQAQRSLTEAMEDAQIARARELSEDGFMRVQIARFHQRRAQEAVRHHQAELTKLAERGAAYDAAMADRRARGAAELAQQQPRTPRPARRHYSGTGWPEDDYPQTGGREIARQCATGFVLSA